MLDISFYEVIDQRGRWMASYSTLLDSELKLGADARYMAFMTHKRCGGSVFAVSQNGERIEVSGK